MASTFTRIRRPLLTTAAVMMGAAGGALIYTHFTPRRSNSLTRLVPQRDADGAIIPPKFPKPKSRAEQLADLRRHGTEEYDLLIIGGGATGTGIALDAVTRGLKVALVERDDFSSGTSSKSTKLVHGGVRYLEKAVWNLDYGQLELVMEALHERKTFLDVAPHLSSSLPILLPLQKWWQAPYFWAGTKAYDLLAGSQGLEGSYYMTRTQALKAFPLLKRETLAGALVYYDGQQNDSRMNVSLALTAALYGATVANHVEVTELEKDSRGKICGARVRDVLAGGEQDAEEFVVRAKGVINATGPFTDGIERMDNPTKQSIVAPSAGAHIMLPGHLSPSNMGMLDASTSDGRVVFVLPWQGYTLAGTTDAPCLVEREPIAKQDEVDFILKEVNKWLTPGVTVSRSDILATWSGIRPLVRDPKAKSTESLVRSHLVAVSESGLLTCAGGKWTTYRQMAEDAVDEAMKVFNLQPQAVPMPDISGRTDANSFWMTDGTCKTRNLPVIGAHGFYNDLPQDLFARFGIDAEVAKHLASNYGDRAWEVVAGTATPPTPARLTQTFPVLEAEVRYCVRNEYAQTAADFLARRTRLAFLDVKSALDALPRVVDIMAEELNWSSTEKEVEWLDTVRFLRSMGLPLEMMGITREEVLAGKHRVPVSRQGGVASGGMTIGGGAGVGLSELGPGAASGLFASKAPPEA